MGWFTLREPKHCVKVDSENTAENEVWDRGFLDSHRMSLEQSLHLNELDSTHSALETN